MQDLLQALRCAGVAVGVAEFREAARLLSQLSAHGSQQELGRALGALLGKSRSQAERIEALVGTYLRALERELEPPPALRSETEEQQPRVSSARQWARPLWRRWLVRSVFVWGLGLAFIGWRERGRISSSLASTQKERRQESALNAAKPPGPVPTGPPLPTLQPVAPPLLPQPPLWPWAGSGAMLVLPACLAGMLLVQRRRRQRLVGSALRQARGQLAALPEPASFCLRPDRLLAPPWSGAQLDRLADQLRSSQRPVASGRELDVEQTIRRSSQQAGLPMLVYRPQLEVPPLVVLLDVSARMQPWLSICQELIDGLAQRGVRLCCLLFDDLGQITNEQQRASLRHAVAQHSPAALLLISTGPLEWEDATWSFLPLYQEVARRAWLNPIPWPQLWPARLQRNAGALHLLPLHPQGIDAACEVLSGAPFAVPAARLRAQRGPAVDWEMMVRLKELLRACGSVNLKTAELLRQQLLPQLPPATILFLLAASQDASGRELRLVPESETTDAPPEERTPSMAAQLRSARQLLLDVLRDSEPPAHSLAHLRWQLRYRLHEAQLREHEPERVAEVMQAIRGLAQGPLCEEVLTALQGRTGRAVWMHRKLHRPFAGNTGGALPLALRRLERETRAALRSGRLPGSHQRCAPRFSFLEGSLFLLLGAGGLFLGLYRYQPEHVLAYSLAWEPGQRLHIAARQGAPEQVELVREQPVPVRIATIKLNTGQAAYSLPQAQPGESYYVRAPLRLGRFAYSLLLPVPIPSPAPVIGQANRQVAAATEHEPPPRAPLTATQPNASAREGTKPPLGKINRPTSPKDRSPVAPLPGPEPHQTQPAEEPAPTQQPTSQPPAEPRGVGSDVAAVPVRIDRTEVTNRDYQRCVQAGVCSPPGKHSYECSFEIPGQDEYPVNCIAQEQARRYCGWVGKRLPTAQEWERAALGERNSLYPWGDHPPSNTVCWKRRSICAAGSSVGDRTERGVMDLAGNLREWVNESGTTRGGTWHDRDPERLQGRASPLQVKVTDSLGDLGFRCTSD